MERSSDILGPDQTVLLRVTGIDKPGITAGILHILADTDATVLDMEQVVVRDRLNLSMLVSFDGEHSPLKDLLFFGWQRDVHLDFEIVEGDSETTGVVRAAVTVIGTELRPTALAHVADAIVTGGGNIERITRLSTYPVISYELIVAGASHQRLRTELIRASSEHMVDIAAQPEGLARRAKRLVVIDMDSTLIRNEVIDLLAEEAGAGEDIRRITEAAMAGELDFVESLRLRVAALAGLEVEALERVADRIVFGRGARTFARTLRRLGYRTAIISGGFEFFAERARTDLGIDYAFANRLATANGVLTGELEGDIIDGPSKAQLLEEIAAKEGVAIEQTVAVGDGANDLDMLAKAGLGIAFNARPVVDAAADTTLKVPYLDAILFLLGIRREEIEAADRTSPTEG